MATVLSVHCLGELTYAAMSMTGTNQLTQAFASGKSISCTEQESGLHWRASVRDMQRSRLAAEVKADSAGLARGHALMNLQSA